MLHRTIIVAVLAVVAAVASFGGCSSSTTVLSGAGGTGTGTGTPGGTASGTPTGTPSGSPEIPPHSFTVTIENGTSEAVFLNANGWPFAVQYGGTNLQLSTFCSCERCGTGEGCYHGDPVPVAIELPAGQSVVVEAEVRQFVNKSVTDQQCPEAYGMGWCDDPTPFVQGSYVLAVPYDDLAAMAAQNMSDTGSEQWGYPVWMGVPFGVVQLSQETTQAFELSGDASSIEVVIQ